MKSKKSPQQLLKREMMECIRQSCREADEKAGYLFVLQRQAAEMENPKEFLEANATVKKPEE